MANVGQLSLVLKAEGSGALRRNRECAVLAAGHVNSHSSNYGYRGAHIPPGQP